jgi:hypothetical protein
MATKLRRIITSISPRLSWLSLRLVIRDGLSETMQRIVDAEDGKAIMQEFKKIILMAYGTRSEDGKRFIKTQELRDAFASSEAYSELFMELCTNAEAATDFVNGMIPAGLSKDVEAITVPSQAAETNNTGKSPKIITKAEAEELDQGTLLDELSRGEIVIQDSSQVAE